MGHTPTHLDLLPLRSPLSCEQIATRLQEALRTSHLSQATVARATNLSKSTISRIVATGDCWISDLVRVSRVLSIDPLTLLVGDAPAVFESRELVQLLTAFTPPERHVVVSILSGLIDLRSATVDTVLTAVRPTIADRT